MAFGRLERTTGSQPMSEINMTPLVDVMLVLVVIFIITAPLLTSAIKLDLPTADSPRTGTAPSFVVLSIDKGGQYFFNDQLVDAAELSSALDVAAKRNPNTEVQLRADTAVAYGRVVEVMGLAQKAGLNRIGFVAQELSPPRAAAAGVAAP